MFYIVIVSCWISSVSDDQVRVFLHIADDGDAAIQQAKSALGIGDDQIFDVAVKAVDVSSVGLVYSSQ